MEILEHGNNYYNDDSGTIICENCNCKYKYDKNDIIVDATYSLTSYPAQYKRYIKCPECYSKVFLSNIYENHIPQLY